MAALSFEELQSLGTTRKRKRTQLERSVSILKALAFADINVDSVATSHRELETLMIAKMGYKGFSSWLEYTEPIPKAAVNFMLPCLRKIIADFTGDSTGDCISEKEALQCFKLTRLLQSRPNCNTEQAVIANAGALIGHPVTEILSPPYEKCPNCNTDQVVHNRPSQATIFDMHKAKYGNVNTGYKMYNVKRTFIETSNET